MKKEKPLKKYRLRMVSYLEVPGTDEEDATNKGNEIGRTGVTLIATVDDCVEYGEAETILQKRPNRQKFEKVENKMKDFKDVNVGDDAIDYADEKYEVIAKGTIEELRGKWDSTGACDDSEIGHGFELETEAIAVQDSEGTYVFTYDYSGAYVKA